MKAIQLGNVCKVRNGYAFKSKNFANTGIPIVRIGEIEEGIINLDNAAKIEENELFSNFLVKKGDVLIAMSGATTGKIGKYLFENSAYQNQRVGCFLPNKKLLSNDYLF